MKVKRETSRKIAQVAGGVRESRGPTGGRGCYNTRATTFHTVFISLVDYRIRRHSSTIGSKNSYKFQLIICDYDINLIFGFQDFISSVVHNAYPNVGDDLKNLDNIRYHVVHPQRVRNQFLVKVSINWFHGLTRFVRFGFVALLGLDIIMYSLWSTYSPFHEISDSWRSWEFQPVRLWQAR